MNSGTYVSEHGDGIPEIFKKPGTAADCNEKTGTVENFKTQVRMYVLVRSQVINRLLF